MTERKSLAEQLAALMDYRNQPDSPPDPLASNWSTEPATVIQDGKFDGDDEPEVLPEDLLIEIKPSINKIRQQFESGPVVKNDAGLIVAIGSLRFSDGTKRERAMRRTETGVQPYMREMPAGAMLGASERSTQRGGAASVAVTISNSNLTGRLLGRDQDGEPINNRPYVVGNGSARKGRGYTPEQSRVLIDQAIANTPVMPAVTVCPPGVASGTAQFSDQFIGMKIGSTGKGGAPNWTDQFMALRDYEQRQESVREMGPGHRSVAESALTAKSIADLGVSGHRRTRERQGWERLRAANDNFKETIKKFAS